MSTPSRTVRVSIQAVPLAQGPRLSAEELAAAGGLSATTLARLVRLGLVQPVVPGADEFSAADALRLRRMLRLRRDLGVNLTGAAIVVDLLERLERLEMELTHSRGG